MTPDEAAIDRLFRGCGTGADMHRMQALVRQRDTLLAACRAALDAMERTYGWGSDAKALRAAIAECEETP